VLRQQGGDVVADSAASCHLRACKQAGRRVGATRVCMVDWGPAGLGATLPTAAAIPAAAAASSCSRMVAHSPSLWHWRAQARCERRPAGRQSLPASHMPSTPSMQVRHRKHNMMTQAQARMEAGRAALSAILAGWPARINPCDETYQPPEAGTSTQQHPPAPTCMEKAPSVRTAEGSLPACRAASPLASR
jgi:hypothetical protein